MGEHRAIPPLTADELAAARTLVPIVNVDVLPVRVGSNGRITSAALIERDDLAGGHCLALVGGRVRRGETVTQALTRHVTTDLGAGAGAEIARARGPVVGEYFPDGRLGLTDPRQHAIALTYLLPVTGELTAANEAHAVRWYAPDEIAALEPGSVGFGQHRLVAELLALA